MLAEKIQYVLKDCRKTKIGEKYVHAGKRAGSLRMTSTQVRRDRYE
ncbi:MAG: hypothetical protein QXU48_06005 [Thermoplasmata archaeon]